MAKYNEGPWGELVAENIELHTENVVRTLTNAQEGDEIRKLVGKIAKTVWKAAESSEVNNILRTMGKNENSFFSIKHGPLSSEGLDHSSQFGIF